MQTDENDPNPTETREWLDALQAVLEREGPERAHQLLESLVEKARLSGAFIPFSPNTPYINTIPPHLEERSPGNHELEWKIRSLLRWNAMALVVNANKEHHGIGGHIASYASAATLYEIGFNHFWKGPDHADGQDLVYIQGHCTPGIYARAYLEGRLTEEQLDRFRMEALSPGLSSYPHPWLMPDFWQFATVSMGLGPIMAIYQARLMKYLHHRGLKDTAKRKVWCFCGDGEMDEPESVGALDIADREKLDNLVFVVNCNLQRLDGPVRGNGKIIQELEGYFRGAGWNVIKLVWGGPWDSLLARDGSGKLIQAMNETVDGEYQSYKARGGAYTREHFFGKYPELQRLVATMSDEEIAALPRGGHDPHKVYAAYAAAMKHTGSPTVILAKTVKGYGMGEAGEGQNITHQQKKIGLEALRKFRDRFKIPVPDDQLEAMPFYKPADDSPEIQYLKQRRAELGGSLPARVVRPETLEIPPLATFQRLLDGTGEREISTTMAFVQLLQTLIRDKNVGNRVVPIIPDEARTFGMDALFPELKIYASQGQKYEPVDHALLLSYAESSAGQILEEGITEAGSMSSFIAAGTSYATRGVPMVPFYTFYSMFGFQRIGDLAWQAADARTRGFLLGATAGRTTLMGEGLQHQDGHSLLLASTIPFCETYDPAFAYEVAAIVKHGINTMYGSDPKDVFYYITLYNENYPMPPKPATKGIDEQIVRGLYRFDKVIGGTQRATILFSGSTHGVARAAATELLERYDVGVELWSATSYKALREQAIDTERWNRLHPTKSPRVPYVAEQLGRSMGPIVAVSDFMRIVPEQIARFVPGRPFMVLGTDGMGRSDTREALRSHFEIDLPHLVTAVLYELAKSGAISRSIVDEAIAHYGVDPDKFSPLHS